MTDNPWIDIPLGIIMVIFFWYAWGFILGG